MDDSAVVAITATILAAAAVDARLQGYVITGVQRDDALGSGVSGMTLCYDVYIVRT